MKTEPQKKEKGQSLVELAISLTVLMLLLSGTVEFGIALFQYVQLRDAAQEGALYGSLSPDDQAGIRARVRAASNTPIDLQDPTVMPDANIQISYVEDSVTEAANCEGDGVQVLVSFDHKISMPFLSIFIGSNIIPLRATVTDTILTPFCPTP